MKNDKLEQGDLAIVIKSLTGQAIGKIVTCLHKNPLGPDPTFGDMWLVESPRADLGSLVDDVMRNQAHVPEAWLKKIPKDPLPDEEDLYSLDNTKELEKA